MDQSLLQDSYELIKKHLPVEGNYDDGPDMTFDRLHAWLTKEIQIMLDTDFNGLLNALYRIDVQEARVREIIELGNPDHIAPELAKVVLRRQIQKVETRRKYSSG